MSGLCVSVGEVFPRQMWTGFIKNTRGWLRIYKTSLSTFVVGYCRAKNSTKLQRLLLSVRVNSSTQLEIAKIIKQSPELKILKSLSKRLAFQHLGLMKNIANWCYFDAVVFPNKPSLFAVIPEALLAIESLAQKCHEIAVYLTTGTLEGDIETERVTLQGKSKFATTYYPYFYSKNVRSHWRERSLCLIPQFSTQGSLSELTVQQMS